ncbi:peptidase C39 family protein [Nocardioides humilatus]|uniref:Peptidase C39 family protein n=1 Tax=Nocardioides humilatus TaxID=2607660 RepID=A0A5B1LP52_9ACTN|nr:peptidase C39 family protein [Nocardioides humilatus]KAA1421409.1 peptidase C39 family protein [Nocardioides humilatus]
MRLLAVGLAAALGLGSLSACSGTDHPDGSVVAVAAASEDRSITLTRWDSARQWRTGTAEGSVVTDGRLTFASGVSTTTADGHTYDVARWTSPWVAPGFDFTELITSWSALTPKDSWVQIQVRGRDGTDRTTWDTIGRWTSGDQHLQRSTDSGQSDDGTSVAVDTWRTAGLPAFQLRLSLARRTGTTATPSLDLATVMTSRVPSSAGETSAAGPAKGVVLPVPRFSQMAHRGHYPQWGGGGEAWCSPTSTSMVLAYYDALPDPRAYDWVPADHVDPWVDHAARMTYDHAYDGTGNWPFNTAYAAPLAGKAFVTRLRSVREAEQFLAVGIPLVVSIAFGTGELDGAPIGSSDGHLLVIVGVRDNGNVVVNDPASDSRRHVRRTYDRAQFERLWLEASGGLAYVITDAGHPLPARGAATNW